MSEQKHLWLIRWTDDDGERREQKHDTEALATAFITDLLLDGIEPQSITLWREHDWNFEIRAYVKEHP